jgi:hypothetical protein
MSKKEKLKEKLLSENCDKNFCFEDLCVLVQHLGFNLRGGKGDHSVFHKEGVTEIINLQPSADKNAKPYQVRQVRQIVWKYNL